MSTALYEGLLPKLTAIIALLCESDISSSPQNRQALIKVISEFKDGIAQAKNAATNLAGGQLTIEEQDGIIEMLETMKNTQHALLQASLQDITSSPSTGPGDMQVDSTASTPFGS
ncbi:unnamed protein product [Somion occarium]|uniref:Mediator of RNA polymerase II transcription subunit 9 n=1 Tax=Somion occarium TaxID=3059160 RepID=A0ABP1CPX8_9APHY